MAALLPGRFGRVSFVAVLCAALKPNGRCRSATTAKMSSFFLFFLTSTFSRATNRWRREGGMERMGKETHRGVGATPGHVSPALPHHQAEPCTNTTHLAVPRRGRPRYLAQACLEQSFFAVKLAGPVMLFFKDTAQVSRANNGLFWAGETTPWCQCVDGASPALVLCRHVHILVATRCRGGILTPRREDALQGITLGGWGGLSGLAVRDLWQATGILHWTYAASVPLTLAVRGCEGPGWQSGFALSFSGLLLCHFMNLRAKPI